MSSKTRRSVIIGRLFANKKFVAALSVIAAVVFWAIVNLSEGQAISLYVRNVPVNITVDGTIAGNLSLGIVSGVDGQTVDVAVTGPRYVVATLTADDFYVTSSLDSVTAAGQYTLVLEARKNSSKTGFNISSVTPSNIKVVFDRYDTVTTEVATSGVTGFSTASGSNLICGRPVLANDEYSSIALNGPVSELGKVAAVTAKYDGTGVTLSASETFDAEIVLLDSDGAEIDVEKSHITLPFTTVKVVVPVLVEESVPVRATFKNAPAAYAENGIECSLSVHSVTVRHPADTNGDLSKITLTPIDFAEITAANNTFDCAFIVPDGVELVDAPDIVKVTVTAPLEQKILTVPAANIKQTGLPDGLKFTVTKGIANVVVCGKKASVEALGNADLYGTVDLSGSAAGNAIVTVKIYADPEKYPDVWAVGSYTVRVNVSANS